MPIPVVGRTYKIHHTRKGRCVGRIVSVDDGNDGPLTWVDVLIVSGELNGMGRNAHWEEGETIRLRRCFCTFREEKSHADD